MIVGLILFAAAVVVFYVAPSIPWGYVAIGAAVLMIPRTVRQVRARPTDADADAAEDWLAGAVDDDWKPCASPQCRAPILRASRKTYCGESCKRTASYLRARDVADAEDTYGEIPF